MITLEFMNEWLGEHKSHQIRFVRERWPLLKADDPEGFPLPAAADIKDPVVLTLLRCMDCKTGFKVAVDNDLGQDISK
jgi:hypothetical protein